MKKTAILLIHCPDQTGLVAAVTDFLHRNNGNVISLDQHVDRQAGRFFMRVEWELQGFNIPSEKIDEYFGTLVGQKYQMEWQVHLSEHKPRMASVVDLERPEQLPEVLMWSEEIAPHVEIIMIIPKYFSSIAKLPRQIGGKKIRLGYSVPTRHGGTSVPVWEFAGWPVHLLGGSPHAQKRLCPYMDVVSVDGNMHQLMATKYCSFYDPKKSTKRGYWPSISDYDGQKWGDGTADADAPYEAFRRSCENINRYWRVY